jgi:SAM-dependent methyltransferase
MESRRLVTNDAILKTVVRLSGQRILDVGCGEGWLSHKLTEAGRVVAGFDSSSELIGHARHATDAKFLVLSYEQFTGAPYSVGQDFDIAVCNFSLLGETIAPLLKALHQVIKPCGHLLIQTVHPFTTSEGLPYRDGWREETFEGLPGEWSAMAMVFPDDEFMDAGGDIHRLAYCRMPGAASPCDRKTGVVDSGGEALRALNRTETGSYPLQVPPAQSVFTGFPVKNSLFPLRGSG